MLDHCSSKKLNWQKDREAPPFNTEEMEMTKLVHRSRQKIHARRVRARRCARGILALSHARHKRDLTHLNASVH